MQLPQINQLPTIKPIGVQLPTVTPIPTLPKFPKFPSISIMPYGSKWIPTPAQQRAYAQNDLVSNYNDPYALNSMADVIAASFNDKIDNANIIDEGPLQILNIIPNTLKMIKDTTIDPISQGEFGKAAINNFMAFAETADILANPVKGYLMEGEEGWIKGWGFSDAGRHNYDWDTGNAFKNIFYEIISDPINWFTWIAKPIILGFTKTSFKAALIEGGAQAGKQLDDIIKSAVKAYMKGSKGDLVTALTKVGKIMGTQADEAFVKSFETAMEYLIKNAEHYVNINILKGLTDIIKVADKLDDAVLKAAIRTTPVFGAVWLAKKGITPLREYAKTAMLKAAKPFMTPMGIIDVLKIDDFLKAYDLEAESFNAIYRELIGIEGVDEALKLDILEGPAVIEMGIITDYLKLVSADKYPNAVPEHIVQQVKAFIDEKFAGDGVPFLEIVHSLNEHTGGKYKWFEDYLSDMLDIDVQTLRFHTAKNSEVWDYIIANIFTNEEMDLIKKYAGLERFIKEQHGVSIEEFIMRLDDINARYDNKFKSLRDVVANFAAEYNGRIYIQSEVAQKYKLYLESEIKVSSIPIMQERLIELRDAVPNLQKRVRELAAFPKNMAPTKMQVKMLDNYLKQYILDMKELIRQLYPTELKEFQVLPNKITEPIMQLRKDLVKAYRGNKHKEVKILIENIEDNLNKAITESLEYLDTQKEIAEAYTIKRFISNLEADISKDALMYEKNYLNAHPLLKAQFKQIEEVNLEQLIKSRMELQEKILDYFTEDSSPYFLAEAKVFGVDLGVHVIDKKTKRIVNAFIDPPKEFSKEIFSQRSATITGRQIRKYVEEWYDVNGKQINMSLDSLVERIETLYEALYYAPVEDADAFNEAVENLYNTIKFLQTTILGDMVDDIAMKSRNLLTDLLAMLEEFTDSIKKYTPNFIDVNKNAIYYKFQLEKSWVTESILADEEINLIVDTMLTEGSAANTVLKNLAKEGNYEAIHALEGLQHFVNYRKFRQGLAEADIRPEFKSAFLSTIQKFAKSDATLVAKDIETYMFVMLNDTQKHYNSIVMKNRLDLGTLLEKEVTGELREAFEKEVADLGLTNLHTADYDVVSLKYITKALLEKELPDSEDFIKVFFDIETTGLNKNADDIIQFALHTDGEGVLKRNIKSDLMPTLQTIKELTGEETNLADVYKNLYQYDADSETVRFLEMLDYLDSKLATGKKVQLVGHNLEEFDIPFLKAKLQRMLDADVNNPVIRDIYVRGNRILQDVDIIDTYKILCDKNGYMYLNNYEKGQLYELVRTLANDQSTRWYQIFGEELSEKVIDEMGEIYVPYLIQPMNSSVGKMMQEIGTVLNDSLKGTKAKTPHVYSNLFDIATQEHLKKLGYATQEIVDGAQEHFREIADAASKLITDGKYIQDRFIEVSTKNRELGLFYFDKSIFSLDKEDFIKQFVTDLTSKEYQDYSRWYDTFMGNRKALNMSQAMYSVIDPVTGERVFLTGTRLYGYKIGIDTAAVREFFGLEGSIEMKVLDKYSQYARYIEGYVSQVKNGNLLMKHAKDINELVDKIIKDMKTYQLVPEYLLKLKKHDSYLYNYAILQFIYNRPEEILADFWDHTSKNPTLTEGMQEVLKMLADPKKTVRSTRYTDEAISFMDEAKELIAVQRTDLQLKEIRDIVATDQDVISKVPDTIEEVYEQISYLHERVKQIKDLDYKIYLNNKLEIDEYISTYNEHIELLKVERDQLKVANAVDKTINKIKNIQEVADIDAIHKTIQDAISHTQDDMDYLQNIMRSLDENSAQRAYLQKRYAQLHKIYDNVVNYKTLIESATTLEDKVKIINNSKAVANNMSLFHTRQILSLSNDELFNHLATRGHRMITIGADSPEMFIDILKRKDELKKLGIDVTYLKEMQKGDSMYVDMQEANQLIITLNKDVKIDFIEGKWYHGADEIVAPQLKEADIEILLKDVDLSEAELNYYRTSMREAREQLINLTEGAVAGALGETATQKYYQKLYYSLPKEVRDTLPAFDEFINKDTVSSVNINHSVLGTIANRQKIAGYLPSDLTSLYANVGVYASKYSSQISQYLQLYFDEAYSINVGLLKDMDDLTLLESLQNVDGITLAYLKDLDGKPLPVRIKPSSLEDIKEARRLNAVIIPTQTFNKSFDVIQDFNWSESRFNFWHKIIYAYKSGFLANAGVLFRNMIDSTMKNMISTGDPIGIIQNTIESLKTYSDYKIVRDDLMKMGGMTKENVENYFKNMNAPMSSDMFALVHGFMEDGPSAGEIPALRKYFTRNNNDGIWAKYVHLSSKLLDANTEFEHITRLSEYLWAIKHGFTNSAAYELVTKTHFDYGLKTKGQMLAELVFPFYTFKMRNLEYWIDAVEANPILMSLFRDIMTPIWNFDSYDEKELEYNRSLQYQILSGNLPLHEIIKSAPKELTLKINPSFMDAYNTLTDPMGAVQSSLAPPFKFLLNIATKGVDEDGFLAKTIGRGGDVSFLGTGGYDDSLVSLIPYAGALYQRHQNAKKYGERTGLEMFDSFPVAGEMATIFGATQRWENRVYPQTKPLIYSPSKKLPRPRKISTYVKRTPTKKPRVRRSYPTKVYANKTYYKNYYHKANYNNDNIYKKLYTQKGVSKLRLMMEPTTPMTLKYKLRLMHHYFR